MSFIYTPLYKPNQVTCGTGKVVVVTGWTRKEAVARHLQPHHYAAIGQLYSPTRGIDYLIRNLLYNPHVCSLVILQATPEDSRSGGGQCLWDFWQNGCTVGQSDRGTDCWCIRSAVVGYIDRDIPEEILENLRQRIVPFLFTYRQEAITFLQNYQPLAANSATPLIFPKQEPQTTILPGEYYGHRITGDTIAAAWVKILQRIRSIGAICPTAYDSQGQELLNVLVVVKNEPPDFYFPDPNYLPCSRAFISEYQAQILEDCGTDGEGVRYTYGTRLRSHFGTDQIQQVIDRLSRDRYSTRAVMSLWDVQDHQTGSPPCLNHIWVKITEGYLSLTATFRSNDMFAAWPANAFGLRALQQHLCTAITEKSGFTLRLGALMTLSQSAHIYDDCWENADRVISDHYGKHQRTYTDPIGNFLISVENERILIEHTTPGSGETVACYEGRSAHKIYQLLASHYPSLDVEHALYLGTELQKAELAISLHLLYRQDQKLSLPLNN